jgi:hypothetical protein
MPIPKPSGETQKEYISKCMSAIGGEYPQDQSLAICYDTWREENFKGINLVLGKVDMKEPCWDGYEQYGTKIVDGREVPNCIPIKD